MMEEQQVHLNEAMKEVERLQYVQYSLELKSQEQKDVLEDQIANLKKDIKSFKEEKRAMELLIHDMQKKSQQLQKELNETLEKEMAALEDAQKTEESMLKYKQKV